jgi:hypothetical protein
MQGMKYSALALSAEWYESLSDTGPGPQSHEFCRFPKFMRVQTIDGKALKTSKARPVVIYALIDPRDMTARYVGQTRQGLRVRLSEHWSAPCNHELCQWRDDLSAAGLRFRIAPITVSSVKLANEAEKYWIAFYRSLGTVYNVSAGNTEPTSSVAKRDAWGLTDE